MAMAALPVEAQLDGLLELDPYLEPYSKDLRR
ncbi:hypothetical protein chiPu_0024248, partial [Chiloscyllium punctatum]|nr:hypothetical protein [Chiloscyllium punctatum]